MQISRLESAIAALKQLAGEVSLALPLEGLREQIRRFSQPMFSWPPLRTGNKVARTPLSREGWAWAYRSQVSPPPSRTPAAWA